MRRPSQQPRSRARELEQGFHVIFIGIERAKRGEISGASIALSDQVFSSTPGEFRLAVFYNDDVGHHAGMASVSVGERMNSGQLMMKTKQRVVYRERLVLQPASRVGEELGNSLHDLFRVAADVPLRQTIDTCLFPDVVEHAAMQFPDVRFFKRVRGFDRSTLEGPLSSPQNVHGFIFIELAYGADPRNQLFGFFRPDRSIPVRVFLIEDEVHLVLRRFRRR